MAKKEAPKNLLITTDDLGAADEGQYFHGYYFRNNYRKMIKMNAILAVIILFLLLGAITQKIIRKFPDYYTSSTDGNLQRITPLNPPTTPLANIFG